MALFVRGLTKAYGLKSVLEGVDLNVADGEIHALLGPNGSGKTTLIKCLSGAIVPDAGTIDVGGVEHRSFTPREAMAAGTSVIYQHFSLIPSLTVADNVFLGDELQRNGRIDQAVQRAETAQLLEQFSRPIQPQTYVRDLSVGDRQLVEIAKALRRRPRLLVLDEPTAALGEQEARYLGGHLRRLRDEGLAILYTTHILPEIFAIADNVTVLRDGHVVLRSPVSAVDPADVIAAISPGATDSQVARAQSGASSESPLLEIDEASVDGVGPVQLAVGRGEIVAVFGLLGSGRTELLEGIYGIRRISGRLRVKGRPFVPRGPADALGAGVALVPGDRIGQGVFDKLSALDNMLLPHFGHMTRWLARSKRSERRAFGDTAAELELEPDNPNALLWTFSGGNQQKVVLGRWLVAAESVDLLLLDEPTQGIDVGTRRDIYSLVRRLAHEEGKAVLFTSSDPEETLALADRVLVLRRGRIVARLVREGCTEQRLLMLAHGTDSPQQDVHETTAISKEESRR